MDINEEIKKHEPLIRGILKQFGVSSNDMDYDDYIQELRIILWQNLKENKEAMINERAFFREVLKNKLFDLLREKRFMKKKPCDGCDDPCLGRCEKLTKWESEKKKFDNFHHPLPIEMVQNKTNVDEGCLKAKELESTITEIAESILTPLEFEVFKKKILFYTQEEIAEQLGLSQPKITRICKSFKKKLKENEDLVNILPKKIRL